MSFDRGDIDKKSISTVSLDELIKAIFTLSPEKSVAVRSIIDNIDTAYNALTQLEAWKMQGFTTLTEIEDNFNFDFVVTGNGTLVITTTGQFVIKER
jgi:hypothetical protein